MIKKQIQARIDSLSGTLITLEGELMHHEDFNSHTASSIANLKNELKWSETSLNESTDDPTLLKEIHENFHKSLDNIEKKIYMQVKVMPPVEIDEEFRKFVQMNFNFIKPIMAQVPFGTSVTHNPGNISAKKLKIWAVKDVEDLDELLNLIKDNFTDYKPLDTAELRDVAPIYFVIHNN